MKMGVEKTDNNVYLVMMTDECSSVCLAMRSEFVWLQCMYKVMHKILSWTWYVVINLRKTIDTFFLCAPNCKKKEEALSQ